MGERERERERERAEAKINNTNLYSLPLLRNANLHQYYDIAYGLFVMK